MHALRAFTLSAYVSQLMVCIDCPCSTMSCARKAQSLPELVNMTSSTTMVSDAPLQATIWHTLPVCQACTCYKPDAVSTLCSLDTKRCAM